MAVQASPVEINGDITKLLSRWGKGDREAVDELFATVYRELHRLAGKAIRQEGRDRIGPAAEIARRQAQRRADHIGDQRCRRGDH